MTLPLFPKPSSRFPKGRGKCKVCGDVRYRQCLCRTHYFELKRAEYRTKAGVDKTVPCKQCNTPFLRRKIGQAYCSRKCIADARNEKERKYPKQSLIRCSYCDAEFTPHGPLSKYCSQKCYDSAHWRRKCPNKAQPEQKIIANCKHCGARFEQPKRYYINQRLKQRTPKFCSPNCTYAYRRALRGKPPKIAGKCWEAAAKAARKRDGGLCCICGSSEAGGWRQRNIPVDHIIPRRLMERWGLEVHNLANLASLCWTCHAKKTAIEWKLFQGDVVGFVVGLAEINYPKERVIAALMLAEFSVGLAERVYAGISQ